jgi:Xaa-Pro aminopeptidase
MTRMTPRPPHRLERLRSWMDDEQVDCAVVFGADNVNHLCGYWRYYGGPSALVVGRDGAQTLAVMLDEAPIARESSSAGEVLGYGERGFGINLDPVADLIATVLSVPVVASARRVAVASELAGADARLAAAISATTVDATGALYRIRLIKDWDELEKIAASYELCWLAQDVVGRSSVAGTTEIELFTAAQAAAQIAAGEPVEFLADLLSGPNAAKVCCPIHVAGTRALVPGDPVVADIVVRSHGYWGDTADTHVAGTNAEVEGVRAGLLGILEQARLELVPGATGAEVFANMHARITAAFPGGEFPHHGGHALGLTSFEDPHLIPADTTPLESWMVLAVEPGVYFADRFGARVENVFVVTPEGGVELRAALAGGGLGS